MKENQQDEASFELNLKEGLVKFSGPVAFVEAQINKIKSEDFVSNYRQFIVQAAPEVQHLKTTHANESWKSRFENVLNIDESSNKVNILVSFGQKQKKIAMIEISLIYLWAKKQLGSDIVDSKEVRDICQDHGVLDEANFAGHLKKEKGFFVMEKSSKSFTMKLTVPGTKEAERLLESLNNSKSNDVVTQSVSAVNDGITTYDINEPVGEFQSFGEMLNTLVSSKDVDRLLAAGFYLQGKSTTKDFSSGEANDLLKEFGHSLSNTSVFIKNNVDSKRLFKTEGKRFRVSASGETHLRTILNK